MYYYIDVEQAKQGRVLLLEKSSTRLNNLDNVYGKGVVVELIADSLPFGVVYDSVNKSVRAATTEERQARALKKLYAGISLLGKVWTKDDFTMETFVRRTGDTMSGTLNITSSTPLQIPYNSGISIYRSDGARAKMGRTSGSEIYLCDNVSRAYIPCQTNISGNLNVTGVVQATGDVIGMSDKRIKKDFAPVENGWNIVNKLNGYFYRLKKDNSKHIGLIAQEVEEIIPEAVYQEDKTGYKGIAYGNLAGLYVELFKDIDKRLKALESKNGGGR